jgi:hypothetical protein
MPKALTWLVRGVAVLALAYGAFFATILGAMLQPPERFGQIMKRAPAALVWGLLPGPRMWLWARRGHLAVDGGADGTGHAVLSPRPPAGRARLRQLHLTALPPGGARAQQALS